MDFVGGTDELGDEVGGGGHADTGLGGTY
jgi:hypothetical protein